jgi:hypothetical protein
MDEKISTSPAPLPPFEACYAAGCHELIWEKPGYATFRACPEHRRDKVS